MATTYDLVVIGGGPAGYTGAIRASQLGMKVACVEKESALGGTCLRVGCIPSKALLEASERYHQAQHQFAEFGIDAKVSLNLKQVLARKTSIVEGLTGGIAGLFKKNKVDRFLGAGRIVSAGKVEVDDGKKKTEVLAKRILIATGSQSAPLRGVEMDGAGVIGDSTDALSYETVPKHLVVIGAGVIGLELGSVWARLGAKVTVVEYLNRILPGMDAEIAKLAQRAFASQGLEFKLGAGVEAAKVVKPAGKGTPATCEVQVAGETITCDRVLLAVGRRPYTEGLGLEGVGVKLDSRGFIAVDDHYQTDCAGVFAVGDVIPGPMLAHKAEEEAVACVEMMATGFGHMDYGLVPSVVYTEPEVASVGMSEEDLKEKGIPYRKGSFPFMANARARALGSTAGKVKMLAHKETDRILGVHILGPRAGALIAEIGAAMAFGASAEDIARVCHAHPTLSEVVKEAALAVDGRTINI